MGGKSPWGRFAETEDEPAKDGEDRFRFYSLVVFSPGGGARWVGGGLGGYEGCCCCCCCNCTGGGCA